MRIGLALALCLLPLSAPADTAADKGFLTNWLEENLSGAGRKVTIDGFQGALSSQASLTQLTIADDQGVWLTLKDVTLDWSQSALLSGQISVTDLSAGEIDLERMPVTDQASALPSPVARSLALPDLPVSIAINGIAAHKLVLGPSVLGQAVEGSLAADLSLAGGEGAAHLTLLRTGDGPKGHVALTVSFSNATQVLGISLDAAEDAGGIAASLLHVPGAPATSLKIDGTGPLTDFAATVDLATDGQTRLAGKITQTADAAGNRSFAADLAGDPTPVFLPQYASFFGPNVALQVKGQRTVDGALTLDALSVQSQALNLSGSMALAADGQPQKLAFSGTLALASGRVTLPVPSATPITLQNADVTLSYDKASSPLWRFATTVSQFDSGSLAAGLLKVTAEGQLQDHLFDGTARFSALSLAAVQPGLAQALGSTVTGSADFSWPRGSAALQVSNLAVTAPGYALQLQGTIGTMAALQGRVTGHYDDLSRLSELVRKPLHGAVRIDAEGTATPLSGAFDLKGSLQGSALGVGTPQVDALLAGGSVVTFDAKRDETGTVLRALSIRAASLSADLTGSLVPGGANLSGSLSFADLSALGAGYRGSLTASGSFQGSLASGQISAKAQGLNLALGQPQADGLLAGTSDLALEATFANGIASVQKAQITSAQGSVGVQGTASADHSALTAVLSLPDLSALGGGFKGGIDGKASFTGKMEAGTVTLDVSGTNLAVGQAQVDAVLRGSSKVSAQLALTADGVRIDRATIGNPQVSANVSGTVAGTDRTLTLSAKLANLGLLFPQFPGPVTVSGTAVQRADGTRLDLAAKGPGQIDAKVSGTVTPDYARADLSVTGTAMAALANGFIAPRSIDGALRFDLRLNGPLALSSVSGPVSISGGRLADPSLNFGLINLAGTAKLGGGRAQIDMTSAVSSGGKIGVQGSVGLAAPYAADLAIQVQQAVLKDPQLYTTTANGALSFRGPALGGATVAGSIALGATELQIPSTGMGADGGLPGLKHRNEASAVNATRVRAGLGSGTASHASGAGYALDVTISAPNQVFVRGRGLDAELGGNLVLRGTTSNIVPSGAFNLIRGRLDILGRRLVLSEAQVQLQGALVPYVHVVASVESDGITSSVQIDGDATNPTVTFVSSPDLPQEEVLAHLLFNQGLANISPFQAAQLASAVATLAGRGGEGVLGALRRRTGLDNLDVQSDGTGNTSVTAGKYFGDKTYSEVTVDQAGKSSISLNYDVARHITLKGHVDSTGNTGFGIYLKRDY